mgnify:CR=1 FL=1
MIKSSLQLVDFIDAHGKPMPAKKEHKEKKDVVKKASSY